MRAPQLRGERLMRWPRSVVDDGQWVGWRGLLGDRITEPDDDKPIEPKPVELRRAGVPRDHEPATLLHRQLRRLDRLVRTVVMDDDLLTRRERGVDHVERCRHRTQQRSERL